MVEMEMELAEAWAFYETDGGIDLDSVSDTPANVRLKYLSSCMGWRFEHPDRYDQEEVWQNVLKFGRVVPVVVSVVDAKEA